MHSITPSLFAWNVRCRISDPVLPWTQLRRNDVKQKFNRIGLEFPADIERRRELTRSYMKNTLKK